MAAAGPADLRNGEPGCRTIGHKFCARCRLQNDKRIHFDVSQATRNHTDSLFASANYLKRRTLWRKNTDCSWFVANLEVSPRSTPKGNRRSPTAFGMTILWVEDDGGGWGLWAYRSQLGAYSQFWVTSALPVTLSEPGCSHRATAQSLPLGQSTNLYAPGKSI